MQEEADTIQLRIVRTGGALVARSVQYVVVPNGEVEFYGATNEVRFEPGVIEKTVNILARGDGIPEVRLVVIDRLSPMEDLYLLKN